MTDKAHGHVLGTEIGRAVACVLCFNGRVETDGSAAMRGDVELSVVDAVADERSRFVATLTPHRARELAALLLELAANAEARASHCFNNGDPDLCAICGQREGPFCAGKGKVRT